MSESYIYEQPLNEKVRSFLRLEKLFQQYSFHLQHGSDWNNRIAIDSILELLAFTTRSDIKLEILKELERQHSRLERLSKRPQIDQSQLASILKNIQKRIGEMQSIKGQIGQETKNIELLAAISQKSSVPGSICDFDLPALKRLGRPDVEHERCSGRVVDPLGKIIGGDGSAHPVPPSNGLGQGLLFAQTRIRS